MKTCGLEVIILNLDTSDRGSSPSLAVICEFLLLFSVWFCVVVIFGVEKTCFINIRALLSAFVHAHRLASILRNKFIFWCVHGL